jgi:hypothetical protein
MNDYWSLTVTQRAALSRDDVAGLEAFELMKAGAVAPGAYEPIPEPEAPAPDLVMWRLKAGFRDSDLLFATQEDAAAAAALIAGEINDSTRFPVPDGSFSSVTLITVTPIKPAVVPVEVYSEVLIRKAQHELAHRATVQAQNKAMRTAHDKAVKDAKDATGPMWADWYESLRKVAEYETIADTWDRYREMAGDDAVAAKFLANTFSEEAIADAVEGLADRFDGFQAPIFEENDR